jgi:predicted RNA-binding Zn ribbon-like protein
LLVMKKSQDAPGELEKVRAFVNTLEIEEGTDELASVPQLVAWLGATGLTEDGLRATRADLTRAIELREALRSILLAHTDRSLPAPAACAVLDAAASRARLRVRFDERGGTTLEPESAGVNAALGRLIVIIHDAIAGRTWERLKACREHTCEWAFYDHTKNRSGAWCTMDVCGNRAKARAYRERRAAG